MARLNGGENTAGVRAFTNAFADSGFGIAGALGIGCYTLVAVFLWPDASVGTLNDQVAKMKERNRIRWIVLSLPAVLTLLASGCGGPQLMPTPNLYVGSEQNPFASVPEEHANNKVDVLYATDRLPVPGEQQSLAYDHRRSLSLAFGSATVEFGEDVSWEELVAASRTDDRTVSLEVKVATVEEKGRLPVTPYPLVPNPPGPPVRDSKAQEEHDRVEELLHAEIRERLSRTKKKEAYVYIHGYNNTFDDAVTVIGELWHFLGREGIPIAYTWPAGLGGLRGYFYDRESGEFTVYHLKDFLKMLVKCEEIEAYHLIAHSRGTDVKLTALRELYLEMKTEIERGNKKLKIGNLILAAPDLDLDVISQRIIAEEFVRHLKHLTMYMSKSDTAIALSTWLFVSRHRAGRISREDLQPFMQERSDMIRNVSLIDAQVDAGFIGHSYFYSHPAVSSDLVLILRDGKMPGAENGRPLVDLEGIFWRLDNDYPRPTE